MKNSIEQYYFFPRSDVNMVNTPYGLSISLEGCKSRSKPGHPDFPGKIIKVALPAGTIAKSVSFNVEKTAGLTNSPAIVSCAQAFDFVYLDENREPVNSGRSFYLPRKDIYEAAIKTPQPVVRLINTEWIGDAPVAVLEVIPVRYAKNGNVELSEVIRVSIETQAFRRTNPVPLKIRQKKLRDHGKLYQLVSNRKFVEGMNFEPELADGIDLNIESPTLNIPADVDYLIITDNQKWNADTLTPGAATGDMIAEFQRLATWKSQRGLRTYIAKVEDIVNGLYGDYKTGACDLQEVIRNFLKNFCGAKGVEWVLIGGDTSIIPARLACGSAYGRFYKGEASDPDTGSTDGELSGNNTIAWMGTFLGMLVELDKNNNPKFGLPGHILTNYRTGEIIPFDSAGTSNGTSIGWYFCTDDTFTSRSVNRTQWIRVNGPKARINDTMVWYTPDNMIATDLYYSSLYSQHYNHPGKKDWDLLGNGLYGQHSNADPQLDGVDFTADIGLGRAPVETQAEAKVFVDKVIEYEKWDEDPAANPVDRFRKMLYVSANWGTFLRLRQDASNSNPPAGDSYFANPASGYSLLHTKKMPPDIGSKVICHLDDSNRKVLNYNADAGVGNPGWYYAKSDGDLSSSHWEWNFWFIHIKIPVPTNWIVVYGANNSELTPMYFAIDKDGPDSSMTEQETLRKWMKSHFYKINKIRRLYTDETDLSPVEFADGSIKHLTAENLEESLNWGPHFVSLSGHGNKDWVAYLETALVNRTTNGRNTAIMVADSCLTNKYDYDDSVGENALKHAGGGAVAYVGNSRYSWVGRGDEYRLEFFKTMQYTRHLADLNDSRCNFASDIDIYNFWVILAQNLNGDPEMPVYRDTDDAIPRFIGNRNTLELHRSTCQWVEKMAFFNMISFQSVEQGLSAGHDGCYYCLRQHHKR